MVVWFPHHILLPWNIASCADRREETDWSCAKILVYEYLWLKWSEANCWHKQRWRRQRKWDEKTSKQSYWTLSGRVNEEVNTRLKDSTSTWTWLKITTRRQIPVTFLEDAEPDLWLQSLVVACSLLCFPADNCETFSNCELTKSKHNSGSVPVASGQIHRTQNVCLVFLCFQGGKSVLKL